MIKIDNLQFRWEDGADLFLSAFQIQSGEKVFVQGPSGSGKSTLLNTIAGLTKPSAGNVYVDGTNLFSLNGAQRDVFRSLNIGVIFQQFNLLPFLSVTENILLPLRFSNLAKKESQKLAQNLPRLLGVLDLKDHENKPVYKLSVGQQQRVALCRALIGEPKIILADEPTSALDENNAMQFMHLLMQQCEGRKTTLVFVGHDTRLTSFFERVIDVGSSTARKSL